MDYELILKLPWPISHYIIAFDQLRSGDFAGTVTFIIYLVQAIASVRLIMLIRSAIKNHLNEVKRRRGDE